MRLLFAILFSLFPGSVFADALGMMTMGPSILSSPDLPLFQFREGGRHWTSQELEADNINSSFATWLDCYKDPTKPACNNCDSHSEQSIAVIENLSRDRCLPAKNDLAVAYAANLNPDFQKTRDDLICGCYRKNGAGPIGDMAFSLGTDAKSKDEAHKERRKLKERQSELQKGILQKLAKQRLLTERFQTSFSAASYSENSDQAVELGAVYSNQLDDHSTTHETLVHAAAISSAQQEAETRQVTSNDFTSENLLSRPGYCVPYRHFLASKQYPTDPIFYQDLSHQNNFDWKDWNYPILLSQFQRVVGNRDIKTALSNDPKGNANRMFQRIKFLYDNPVLKNIFQSGKPNAPVINELIGILRKMPKPVCNSKGCSQDEISNSKLRDYRKEMATFLRRDDVIAASQTGAESSHGTQIQVAVASALQDSIVSDVLNPRSEIVDASKWRAFCDEKEVQQTALRSKDINFVINLESVIGRRNFEDPSLDKEYADMNNQICTVARTGPRGRKTFPQYLSDICGKRTSDECSIESRPNLVGRFLREFPNSTSPKVDSYRNLATFLSGSGQVASVSSKNIQAYNQISREPAVSRTTLNSDTPTSTISRVEPISNSSLSNFSAQSAIIPTETLVTQPVPAELRRETAQRELKQAESDYQGIRDEISSLKGDIQSEKAKPAGTHSPEYSDLIRKLAELEKKQASQEKLLKQKKAEADAEPLVSKTAVRESTSVGPVERSRTIDRTPVAATTGSVSDTQSSGAGIAPLATSASGASLSPQRLPQRNINAVNLSKYNIQNRDANGGIVVSSSESSSVIEDLRNRSQENILNLPVDSIELAKIKSNSEENLKPYINRCKKNEEVCRLSFTAPGEGGSLEIFVRISKTGFSIIPTEASGRSPASESAVSSERGPTLKQLNFELQSR